MDSFYWSISGNFRMVTVFLFYRQRTSRSLYSLSQAHLKKLNQQWPRANNRKNMKKHPFKVQYYLHAKTTRLWKKCIFFFFFLHLAISMTSFCNYLFVIISTCTVRLERDFQPLLFHFEFPEDNIVLDFKRCMSEEKWALSDFSALAGVIYFPYIHMPDKTEG